MKTLLECFVTFSTDVADYDGDSVPSSLLLNMMQPVQCLQIITFNNAEGPTPSESFRITVTSLTPATLLPNGNSVQVTLFKQCVNGEVRLEGGNNALEGRVQMCYGGIFGFVCDTDSWTQGEADVVCTQLGNIARRGKFAGYSIPCLSVQSVRKHPC